MPNEGHNPDLNAEANLISKLPKTALQALYHYVTGKTENLSKDITGNVVITFDNIENLYCMLNEQLCHYNKVAEPTVTVVVRTENDKSFTYSSWPRFKAMQINTHEITSDVLLKFEFLIHLPDTPQAQRCVISILLDSSLPMIHKKERNIPEEAFGIIFFISQDWKAVKISIDFVDFLVAKIFCGVVEEWFKNLKKTPNQPLNQKLIRHYGLLRSIIGQSQRVGMAIFLIAYTIFMRGKAISSGQMIIAASIGMIIWSTISIADTQVSNKVFRRITRNIVPSVVLLSDGDNSAYSDIKTYMNSPTKTLSAIVLGILAAIGLNLISSFLYAYISK